MKSQKHCQIWKMWPSRSLYTVTRRQHEATACPVDAAFSNYRSFFKPQWTTLLQLFPQCNRHNGHWKGCVHKGMQIMAIFFSNGLSALINLQWTYYETKSAMLFWLLIESDWRFGLFLFKKKPHNMDLKEDIIIDQWFHLCWTDPKTHTTQEVTPSAKTNKIWLNPTNSWQGRSLLTFVKLKQIS